MTSRERRITHIGNSRGVPLPADALKRLSWEETARAMAASPEDWSDWDALGADGLTDIPWQPGRTGASPSRS